MVINIVVYKHWDIHSQTVRTVFVLLLICSYINQLYILFEFVIVLWSFWSLFNNWLLFHLFYAIDEMVEETRELDHDHVPKQKVSCYIISWWFMEHATYNVRNWCSVGQNSSERRLTVDRRGRPEVVHPTLQRVSAIYCYLSTGKNISTFRYWLWFAFIRGMV